MRNLAAAKLGIASCLVSLGLIKAASQLVRNTLDEQAQEGRAEIWHPDLECDTFPTLHKSHLD